MPKYIIERKMPGVGKLPSANMLEVGNRSNQALKQLNGQVQWLESFVTDDRVYCVYISPNEELVRRHAELSGFPADRVSVIRMIIDPTTDEKKEERLAA